MKNISASALIIAIAMMGAVSYNAAADNHGRGPGNGRIESNHGNRSNRSNGHHNGGANAYHPGDKHGAPAHNPGMGRGNAPAGHRNIDRGPAAGHHGAIGHNGPAHRPDVHCPAPRPAEFHRPAPRPRPVAVHHHAPRPVIYHDYPSRYYRRAARRAAAAMATAAAIEATRYAIGAIVSALPPYYTEVIIDGIPYYLSGNILYRPIVINGAPCFEVVDNNYIY